MDQAEIYEETRVRITSLVSMAAGASPVPACPGWSVTDLVAHVTGIAADWRVGNLSGYGTDAWTEAQVASRRGRDVASLLAEWAGHAALIAPVLADPAAAGLPPYMPSIVITDLVAHEHDIRGALMTPGARDSEALHIGLQTQIGGMRQRFTALGLPTLRIEAAGLRHWMVGRDEPAATLAGSAFELFRATGGRRTREEVEAMEWEGEAGIFIPHLLQPPYSWPAASLGE